MGNSPLPLGDRPVGDTQALSQGGLRKAFLLAPPGDKFPCLFLVHGETSFRSPAYHLGGSLATYQGLSGEKRAHRALSLCLGGSVQRLAQSFLPVPDLVRHHQHRPGDDHQVVGEKPPHHHRGVQVVVDEVVAEKGGEADLLGAGSPRHGHKGHRDLQQALHRQHLPVAHTAVAEGEKHKVDHAHLQNKLGNGAQHSQDDALLFGLKVVGVAGEVPLELVDGLLGVKAPLQPGEPPGDPLGRPAQAVEHGLIKHRPEKHHRAPVDHKPQDDPGDDAGVLRLELWQHVDKRRQGHQHKGALEAEELDEQHRRGHPGRDLVPQKVGRLHGLPSRGAGGDVGVVNPQQADFLPGPEAQMDVLASHQQADQLPLEEEVHQ